MAPDIRVITTTTADLHETDKPTNQINKRESQLLFGEAFAVASTSGAYVYGQALHDGYSGYIHEQNLSPKEEDPTHIIDAPLTHLYPEPGFKYRPIRELSFLSRITANKENIQNGFIEVPGHGWVFQTHTTPLTNMPPRNITETALQFLNVPYRYAGRSMLGIDCSGLVQLSLMRAGLTCPRDSDQQASIGDPVDITAPQRGDLVFFEGHVGIMVDEKNILNATSRTQDVRIESLEKLEEIYNGITATRRPNPPKENLTLQGLGEPAPHP